MKKIGKTIGFVVVDENNKIVEYIANATDNGMCYKNADAKGAEIAYIPEHADWNNGFVMAAENANVKSGAYTYEDIVKLVLDFGQAYKLTRKQAEFFTDFILSDADWETPETFMYEVDIEDCILLDDSGVFTEEQKRMCEIGVKPIYNEW